MAFTRMGVLARLTLYSMAGGRWLRFGAAAVIGGAGLAGMRRARRLGSALAGMLSGGSSP